VFLDPEDLEDVKPEVLKKARFEEAAFPAVTFESRANLRHAQFNGSAHFDGAQFKLARVLRTVILAVRTPLTAARHQATCSSSARGFTGMSASGHDFSRGLLSR
jgi:uncharacterized protein YjbI with pentapeptide repeats